MHHDILKYLPPGLDTTPLVVSDKIVSRTINLSRNLLLIIFEWRPISNPSSTLIVQGPLPSEISSFLIFVTSLTEIPKYPV